MKRLPRMFTACVMLVIAFAQFSLVKADSVAPTSTPNPKAEDYVKNEILAGRDADLSKQFPNERDRVISAASIVSLWNDPAAQKLTRFKIYFATIEGDIEAEGLSIPFNVEFHNCTFNGEINMASAAVKTFRIDDSTVNGAVKMGRMLVGGDLALYQSTFRGEVTLFGADINNNLFAKGSKFLGTIPDPNSKYPFELWTTRIGQTTEFSNAVILGEAIVDDAKFGVDVKFDGAMFEKLASFRSIQVGNIADFHGAQFKGLADFESSIVELDANFNGVVFDGQSMFANTRVSNKADFGNVFFNSEVSFESSIMDRDIAFTGATFNGDAIFNYLTVARFFDFDQTRLYKKFSIEYPTIGWPYFADATFRGPVDFEGMQASNDFDFTNASYLYSGEPFKVYLAKVNGRVLFDGFAAPAGLELSHNQFGDLEISSDDRQKLKEINLDSTLVDGDLILDNLEVNKMTAKELEVTDKTTFTRLAVPGELNMSNAHLGFFTMSNVDNVGFWPTPTDNIPNSNLRGMVYNDIGLVDVKVTKSNTNKPDVKEFVDKELEDENWGVLLNMVTQSVYSPQAYRTLEQFLTEKGHPEWAANVELNRKDRERREILPPRSGPWFWSWFLYIFSGYGQVPQKAIGWSVLVILIGAIVFWKEDGLVMLGDDNAKPPYNPFLYSFALFIPYIELGIADKWDPKPDRKGAWAYRHIHKMLGWILAPIALLSFGGVIK
jgi:pentapeptide repeat protein